MFNFLKIKKDKISKEEAFWNYFLKNKSSIEDFIDSDITDYTTYNLLTDEIKKYSSLLFLEVTKNQEGEYVLIITPDGKLSGVSDTRNLYESRPSIDNWVIKKFRQPNDKIQFNYGGLEYPSSDIEILAELNSEKDKIDIQVFIKNMNIDTSKYQTMAWLYLDNILGEFNSIMKIGYVDFFHLDESQTVKESITILELRKLIDKEIYKVDY